MLLQRLELETAEPDEIAIPDRLLKAAREVHVLACKAAGNKVSDAGYLSRVTLLGYATTAALYEDLLASPIQQFWVQAAVSLWLSPTHQGQFQGPQLSLSELHDAAEAARGRPGLPGSDRSDHDTFRQGSHSQANTRSVSLIAFVGPTYVTHM